MTVNRMTISLLTVGLTTLLATGHLSAGEKSLEPLLQRFAKEFVPISPGKDKFPKHFRMGDPSQANQPVRRIDFAHSFHIAKYEVTQELWAAVMGDNPSRWKGDRNSVEMLTYDEAVEFCQRVTKALRSAKLIEANDIVRLPTEAEWEYCTRAGTTTKYSFGDKTEDLDAYAWHTGNAAGNDPPVGAKKPNPWGLHDVHGYLWEWCSAPSGGDSAKSAAHNSDTKNKAVIRGGSWKDAAPKLTSGYRIEVPRKTKDDAIGFRCVLATTKSKRQ